MSKYIDLIGQIKPINNQNFAIADVNDLRGGYIQLSNIDEMQSFKHTDKIKEGMLCFVKDGVDGCNMFQFLNDGWVPWIVQGSEGGSIKIIETLEDLENLDFDYKGQIIFVNEVNELRYYNGSNWCSFSKYYIQDTPPTDLGGIWIDTSENKEHLSSNTVIQELLQVISVLQEKVHKLEFAFQSQMDFGDFTNNKYYEYDGQPSVEPDYGTSPEEDEEVQKNFIENGIDFNAEPIELKEELPNAKHLCIKSGTYAEMKVNEQDFLPKELLWCYDTQQLWIKDPKTYKLIQIGSAGGDIEPPIPEYMEGILTELVGSGSSAKTRITGIEFADMSNKDNVYLISIKDGKLDIHDYRLDQNWLAGNMQEVGTNGYFKDQYFPIPADTMGSTTSPKIFVNMLYCGEKHGKYDYCPVSHNFVELSNTGNEDLNLKGLYLHYTEKGTNDWVSLPLKGVLKSNSTFLIKGAKCSVWDSNTTYIKVGEPDMYWTKDITYNATRLDTTTDVEAGIEGYSIWDENNEIQFSYNCSFYISGEPSADYYKTNVLNLSAPYKNGEVVKWYVDLIGIGSFNDLAMPNEKVAFPTNNKYTLLYRYFSMDPVTQATKALSARSNATDWYYIDLLKINPKIDVTKYTPKNSKENKNIFYDKTLLKQGPPNIITCSLGYNAHTTRCFNWVSVGYYDEYIMIKKEGEEYGQPIESFKEGDGRPVFNNRENPIYNRIRSITTDGTCFTVHKLILDFEEPLDSQKYYYKVGRDGAWSDERSFTLRSRKSCIDNNFNFLQVTDNQSFNAEEYETWRLSAEVIVDTKQENPYHFCINTGDATQSGNRINEWLDYFKGGDCIFKDTEQMYTVGNNDLCPVDVYVLGNGSEIAKSNPINVEYFFTFELPFEIPYSKAGVYIPCVYSFIYGNNYFLAANSEISEYSRVNVFKDVEGVNVFDSIREWCENDVARLDENINWRIAYCHESPFTIITADLIMKYLKADGSGGFIKNLTTKRGGSRINTVGNYWFSQFLQNNNFKVCFCGHKHTYSNSRYIIDDPDLTMEPIVYSTEELPKWYVDLPNREKNCVRISTDNSKNYVRYIMSQATGFKLVSNKELPAQNTPWLMEYYPVTSQIEDVSSNTAKVTANSAQLYSHYIIWNVGKGTEVEKPEDPELNENRDRIMATSFKIMKKADTGKWAYKYNVPIDRSDLKIVGGNGSANPNNKIIIEKQL